jgi:hypothetical protein
MDCWRPTAPPRQRAKRMAVRTRAYSDSEASQEMEYCCGKHKVQSLLEHPASAHRPPAPKTNRQTPGGVGRGEALLTTDLMRISPSIGHRGRQPLFCFAGICAAGAKSTAGILVSLASGIWYLVC